MKKMLLIGCAVAGMLLGGCVYDKSGAHNARTASNGRDDSIVFNLAKYISKDGRIIVTGMDETRMDEGSGCLLRPVYYKKKINGKFGDWQEVWCVYDTGSSGNYSYSSLDGKFIFVNNWSSYPEGCDEPPITVEYEENGSMVEKYMTCFQYHIGDDE